MRFDYSITALRVGESVQGVAVGEVWGWSEDGCWGEEEETG